MTEQTTRRTAIYEQLHESPEFQELRHKYRGFAIPWTIAFLSWYMLYVVCSMWAPEFMSHVLFGNINVALVFGLLQFVSTFTIAWLYSRHANRHLDPLAERIEATFTKEVER
jgi:uncharacterized membrane protein (DUF485 family)